jgi:putative ABC transport system ATP-binding protein
MIRLVGVERSHRTRAGETHVLRQINLEISEGDFLTIMGPSGAGKSTLLSILGFYDHGWQGEYWFRDTPVHKLGLSSSSFTCSTT